MQKTDGIIEDKISDYLRDLVDEGYIKWKNQEKRKQNYI